MKTNKKIMVIGVGALLFSGFLLPQTQDRARPAETGSDTVEHADCSFFVQRNKFRAMRSDLDPGQQYRRGALTNQVAKLLGSSPTAAHLKSFADISNLGTIDKYLFADMQAKGVTPADKTTDFEFVRRVTLDLTGRIPAANRVLAFVTDTTPDKRAKLIDELLAKPEWVDKWTM